MVCRNIVGTLRFFSWRGVGDMTVKYATIEAVNLCPCNATGFCAPVTHDASEVVMTFWHLSGIDRSDYIAEWDSFKLGQMRQMLLRFLQIGTNAANVVEIPSNWDKCGKCCNDPSLCRQKRWQFSARCGPSILLLVVYVLVLSSYFLLLQRSKWLLLELFEWDLSHFVDVSRKRIIDLAAWKPYSSLSCCCVVSTANPA